MQYVDDIYIILTNVTQINSIKNYTKEKGDYFEIGSKDLQAFYALCHRRQRQGRNLESLPAHLMYKNGHFRRLSHQREMPTSDGQSPK